MIGRGAVSNPALPSVIKCNKNVNKADIKAFYYDVYYGYKEILSGNTPLMYKMKELLIYMSDIFENAEKIIKKIKKSKNINELDNAVFELFNLCEIKTFD
jgi:tRNA-dihydrouridine synthase